MSIASFPFRSIPVLRSFMLCLAGSALFAGMCFAAPNNGGDKPLRTPREKAGSAIFHKRCIGCHNKQRGDATPFGPPNLYTAFHGASHLTAPEAEKIIINGKGNMPTFGSILSKTDIRDVIAYLQAR